MTTTHRPAVVSGPVRPGDRLLVSVGEALWRTRWDLDRATFMSRLEVQYPDAMVMTGKGVRVDILQLLAPAAGAASGPVTLPSVQVVGRVEMDSVR